MTFRIEAICSSKSVSFASAVCIALVFLLLAASGPVQAADNPLYVFGKVTDSAGTPISGAAVSVENTRTHVVRTDPDGTNAQGLYGIVPDFGTGDYDVGDTILVTVTCGLGEKQNSTVVTQDMVDFQQAEVNATYGTVIPEFGGLLGVVTITIALGFVAVVLVGRKKKE
jgi:hypothetical protein